MTMPALELDLAYRACEEITRREAANFHYGIRLLPRDKRQAMSAVYAFARRVDDIGDDASESRRASSLRSRPNARRSPAVADGAIGPGPKRDATGATGAATRSRSRSPTRAPASTCRSIQSRQSA